MRRAHAAVCQVINDITHILGSYSNRVRALRVDMVIDHCDKILDQRVSDQGGIAYRRPGRLVFDQRRLRRDLQAVAAHSRSRTSLLAADFGYQVFPYPEEFPHAHIQ